jgi:DNA polymerase III epsilon subunit-like protein
MAFTPFTDNIIFYDTEFSSLDPYKGEILSIGAVKMNDEEFYCELEYDGEYSDWVTTNLLHTLTAPKVSRLEAQRLLKQFVGESRPYALAYVNQFDTIYTHKLFEGRENGPFHWLPLDFASILVGLGYHPEVFRDDDYTKLAAALGVTIKTGHSHNALDDARFLREVYLKLVEAPDLPKTVV